MNKKVTIIWRYLPDYRVPFYQRLRDDLLNRNIDLNLIYGRANEDGMNAASQRSLPWAKCVDHLSVTIGRIEVCWQPYVRYLRDADLIIVEQANRLLLNYWLMARRCFTRQKVAFWGHGRNLRIRPDTIRNTWKRLFVNNVDWWFAYTDEVKEKLTSRAFPPDRITNVQNAIDTEMLFRTKAEMPQHRLDEIRKELGLGSGPIGIYCGRMYKEKRLEFLLEACRKVRHRIPTFEAIFVGSGEEQDKVTLAARECPWIHYVGPKHAEERVPYFLLSDVSLVPGSVGLVIIDCFALEVPLVTTSIPFHTPEVTYLKSDQNGLMTADNLEDYATGICNVLTDPMRLRRLKDGCREAASVYTVQAMVKNFSDGIAACLET
jgi:glycosyltransferase involved in cell wall biosynthesis